MAGAGPIWSDGPRALRFINTLHSMMRTRLYSDALTHAPAQALEQQLRRQAEAAWREEHPPEPLDVLQQQSTVAAVGERFSGDVQGNDRVAAWKKVCFLTLFIWSLHPLCLSPHRSVGLFATAESLLDLCCGGLLCIAVVSNSSNCRRLIAEHAVLECTTRCAGRRAATSGAASAP